MPIQSNPPHPFNMSRLVDLEVQNLLAKGAIEICSPCPNQFISNIFTISKKDGGRRPVVDMQELNQFGEYLPFKAGVYIATERYSPERGLHDKAGSSRCLLDYSSRSKIKDLFKIFFVSSHVYHSASHHQQGCSPRH